MTLHILKATEDTSHWRLDIFLARNLPNTPSRNFVKKLFNGSHVKVNELCVKPHYKVEVGDDIAVQIPDNFLTPQYAAPENIPLNIVYEDDALLVINKPIGMLTHPTTTCATGTLVNALLYYATNLSNINTDMRPGIVHRLDKETSGLILVAKDNIAHTKLAKQFKRHTVKKRYVAIVSGDVAFDQDIINAPIGPHQHHHEKKMIRFDSESAKKAITTYCVLKRGTNATYIALYPQTGRTHQLRVHMAYLTHPILGDDKYGKKSTFPRLALHAQSISFTHPRTNQFIGFSIPPPSEFPAFMNHTNTITP